MHNEIGDRNEAHSACLVFIVWPLVYVIRIPSWLMCTLRWLFVFGGYNATRVHIEIVMRL